VNPVGTFLFGPIGARAHNLLSPYPIINMITLLLTHPVISTTTFIDIIIISIIINISSSTIIIISLRVAYFRPPPKNDTQRPTFAKRIPEKKRNLTVPRQCIGPVATDGDCYWKRLGRNSAPLSVGSNIQSVEHNEASATNVFASISYTRFVCGQTCDSCSC
jgi:hypothetical protein